MNKTERLLLNVEGIHCAGCVSTIEKGLGRVEGIKECRVNFALHSASIDYDANSIDQNGILKQLQSLGYKAKPGSSDLTQSNDEEVTRAWRNMLFSLIFAIPLMIVAMVPMLRASHLFSVAVDGAVQLVLSALALFWAGRSILADAARQTRRFAANMNSLIALGSLTAFFWSVYVYLRTFRFGQPGELYFDSAGMIITLILVGRFLESRSKKKAGDAIRALGELRPAITTAIINGVEVEIEAAAAQPEMVLLVRPGEKVPADGVVLEGNPVIDESLLTGESYPQQKRAGVSVIGGSINGNLSFKMKVTETGERSFLNSIIRMVSEAQSRKAPVQRQADRIASIFVPSVLTIAVASFGLWYWLAPESEMLIKSLVSVLIVACPCALGLATPTAVLAGTGRAARQGIIIRGGDILEDLATVDTVIFDKTGTLTQGRLDVVNTRVFGKVTEKDLVRLAGSAEKQSEHPVAKAIVRHMEALQIESAFARDIEALPGFGLKGDIDNRPILIGSRALMEESEINLESSIEAAEQEMSKGRTVVFVASDNRVAGIISLSDVLRSEAADVVAQLKKSGKMVMMISGDNRRTAKGIASLAGVDTFEAEIKPDQKKFIVESCRKSGFNVAMIGDGINDAPALAMANVGVAIGSGADVAKEAAGVVLIRSDLNSVLKMFEVSNMTLKIIRQNLFWAFFYNVAAIPIAAGLFYPVFGWSLSPMIAAAAMAFSSLFVVTNSLRLNTVKSAASS